MIPSRVRRGAPLAAATLALAAAGACQSEDFGTVPTVEEVFNQASAAQLDILWVVDNSQSMVEEQTALGNSFQSFISAISAATIDYHIGVITTDSKSATAGQLVGAEKVIAPGPQAEALFRANIRVGVGGSANETGLEAARRALSEPNVSGANAGFLRPGAALFIVFVSDEDDGSFGQPRHFARFFEQAKGIGNDKLVTASAIVGYDPAKPDGGEALPDGSKLGCQVRNSFGAVSASATFGERYIRVAEETEGEVVSICQDNFAGSLERLGLKATGIRRKFVLEAPPNGGATGIDAVLVNGELVDAMKWMYLQAENAIEFTADAIPPVGAEIRVRYRT